jgi:hypothetical protein
MKTVKEIITEQVDILNSVSSKVSEKFSEFTLDQIAQLTEAVYHEVNDWMLSEKINAEKQARMDSYHKPFQEAPGKTNSGGEAPTTKQVNYATQLGIDVVGKTKKEVSDLIDKAMKKQKE